MSRPSNRAARSCIYSRDSGRVHFINSQDRPKNLQRAPWHAQLLNETLHEVRESVHRFRDLDERSLAPSALRSPSDLMARHRDQRARQDSNLRPQGREPVLEHFTYARVIPPIIELDRQGLRQGAAVSAGRA